MAFHQRGTIFRGRFVREENYRQDVWRYVLPIGEWVFRDDLFEVAGGAENRFGPEAERRFHRAADALGKPGEVFAPAAEDYVATLNVSLRIDETERLI